MAISVMKQHGFHEPTLPDRLRDGTIVQAKQEQVAWLPSDDTINAMSARAFGGLRASLRAELATIELAKTVRWQDMDAVKEGTDKKLRVRAVQAEKQLRRAEQNYRQLVNNGEHALLATYEQEREQLLAEIQRLNDEKDALDTQLQELRESQSVQALAPTTTAAPTTFGRDEALRALEDVVSALAKQGENMLVARMDSEITFLRSVVERLMAK